MRTRLFGLSVLFLIGCGSSESDPLYVTGFDPPPVADGYTRFVAPAITDVKPGDDLNLCQWLADPVDTDRMVVDVGGFQSRGGHHFTLYATKIKEKIGTSRICTQEDMLSVSFVGAIGGEGNGSNVVKLPPGLAFTLPKGMALMGNAHYINAGVASLDTQSVVDMKLASPDESLKPVGFYVLNQTSFQIPAGGTSYSSEMYCTAKQKLSLFMWGNHMHEHGVSEYSEVIRPDGTTVRMATDKNWTQENTFNTPWAHWAAEMPLIIQPGDKFHWSCTWTNNTDKMIGFPSEMCVASGFTLEALEQTECDTM